MKPTGKNILANDGNETQDEYPEKQGPRPIVKLKYRTELDKASLVHNFEKRGWQRAHGDDKWNIFWGCPFSVK